MTHYKYFRCLISKHHSAYLLQGRERLQIKALADLPVLMPSSLWTPCFNFLSLSLAHSLSDTHTHTQDFAIAGHLTGVSVCLGA